MCGQNSLHGREQHFSKTFEVEKDKTFTVFMRGWTLQNGLEQPASGTSTIKFFHELGS